MRFAWHFMLASLFLGGWCFAAQAQDDSLESVPRVSLSEITANPGQSLMIPLYFTPDQQNPIGSFSIEIEYVSNSLKFNSAEPGDALTAAGATVEAKLTEGKPDDKGVIRSKLRLSVAPKDRQQPQALPEGLTAYLLFDLATTAKPFAIKMATTVVDAQDLQTPPRKSTKLTAKPGVVLVELADTNPEANCFFFTH